LTPKALPEGRFSRRPHLEGERAALPAKARQAAQVLEDREPVGLGSAAGVLEGLVGEAVAAQAEPEVEAVQAEPEVEAVVAVQADLGVEAVRAARKNV